jgi:hypothetical protein
MKRSIKFGVDLLLLMGLLAFIWIVLLIVPGGRAGLEKNLGRAAVAPWELIIPPSTATPEPTPAATLVSEFNKPGACYSAHSLPDAVEVAGNILTSAGMPEGVEYRAIWEMRHPGGRLWLKIELSNDILYYELECGAWPADDALPGRMQLRWSQTDFTTPTPMPQ